MHRIFRAAIGACLLGVFACAASAAGEARIISLSPAVTELVCRLGQGGRLVGRSEVCNYPPEVRKLPVAGRYADPDVESVLRLKPTVVLTNDLYAPRLTRILGERGIRVVVKQCRSVEEYREWVELLGRELDCRENAAAELARFDREIAELRRLKPLGFSLLWVISDSPLLTGGRRSLLSEVSLLAGLKNAGDASELAYYRMSREALLREPPDVIVWANSGAPPRAGDHFWGELAAVRNGRVLRYLHEDTVMRPGPRLPEGIRKLRREAERLMAAPGRTGAAPAVRTAAPTAWWWTAALIPAAVVLCALFGVRWFAVSALAAGVALFLGVSGGGSWLPPTRWLADGEWDPVFVLRLMRQLTALTVGAALAVSGAVFQTVLRNPLAEPFTLGISGGSGVGAALAIVFHLNAVSFLSVPLCALAGALCALAVVLFGAGHRRDGGESILLGGVIVGTIFGSVLMYIISVADNDQLAGVTWWMLGDLQAADPRLLLSSAVSLLAALVILRALAGELNALAFGDAASWNFGGDPAILRKVLIAVASLLAAGTVALAGMIGFVGLMIPHAVRRFRGGDHRKLLPVLAVSGGVFLMLCDLLSRVAAAGRELPIGVITSAVGGSLFLYLLKRRRT